MDDNANKPVFKVDRVYEKGANEGSEPVSYIVALRVGMWTETLMVPRPERWFNSDEGFQKLRSDIQTAKKKLLAKHAIFADEFPEVEAYGQGHIEAEIRHQLDLPKLEAASVSQTVAGEVVG